MIYKVSFEWIKEVCKCRQDRFDENIGEIIDTCRSEFNIPKGCSWGNCSEAVCPFLKIERRLK